MNKIKKIALSIGATVTITIPIASVISCTKISNDKKMNNIDATMVQMAIRNHFPSNIIPDKDFEFTAKINDFPDINISVTHIRPTKVGERYKVLMDAKLSKTGMKSKFFENIDINGFMSSDQKKMSEIKKEMVTEAIRNKLNPSRKDIDIPENPKSFKATLNTLSNVKIDIKTWAVDNKKGVATIDAQLSKEGLIAPDEFTEIKIDGFSKITQPKMDDITKTMVQNAITTHLNPSKNFSIIVNNNKDFYVSSLGGLNHVNIKIKSWVPSSTSSSVLNMKVVISKNTLNSPPEFDDVIIKGFRLLEWKNIDNPNFGPGISAYSSILKIKDDNYFVGTTDKGFFLVNTSKPKWTWTVISSSKLDIYSGKTSSIAKIDDSTLLVGTADKGFFKVMISNNNPALWVWTFVSPPEFTKDSGWESSILKVDSNSLIVATNDKGFFRVHISKSTWTWNRIADTQTTIASGEDASILRINDSTLLIGTHDQGFFEVDTKPDIWVWTKELNPLLNNTNIGLSSSIFKISNSTYIVGTGTNQFLELNTTTWTWTRMSEFNNGDVAMKSSIVKIGENLLMVGTYNCGFFKVDASKQKWIWEKISNPSLNGNTSNAANHIANDAKMINVNTNTIFISTNDQGYFKVNY